MGRFISADPTIQHPYDPQDFNRYAYARNNPIKYIDPTGYGWWSKLWGAIAGIFTYIFSGGPANPAALPAAFAVASFVDITIAGVQAGYNVFQAMGLGAITATAPATAAVINNLFNRVG